MSQPLDDSGDEAEVALELSKVDSFDAELTKALRLSLQDAREREKKREARKRVREQAEVAKWAGRVVDADAEAEAPKQALRKLKEDKIIIDVVSDDEEEAPVAAVGDGRRGGYRSYRSYRTLSE